MKGYAPRAPHFEQNLLPFRPKPREDELFSSWVCHVASGYGIKLQSFCHLLWPGTAIWNRDVDRSSSEVLLRSVAAMTATPLSIARRTLLRELEGKLFGAYIPNGNTKWVMPLGVYHRRRRRPGLQYCPVCLSSGTRHWRRSWRLSLITLCDLHGCVLRDRCPQCTSPIYLHRGEMGNRRSVSLIPASICTVCHGELNGQMQETAPTVRAIAFQSALITRMSGSSQQLDYFDVLAHLASLLTSRRDRLKRFRSMVADDSGHRLLPPRSLDEQISSLFDALELQDRRSVLGMLDWLLVDWPTRLVRCAMETSVRASDLSRDFDQAPAWYFEAIEPLSDERRHRR